MSRLLAPRSAPSWASERSPWLEPEFVECYIRWREECTAVREAYGRWTDAEHDAEPFAYAAYVAALEREERAADVYRDCADRM